MSTSFLVDPGTFPAHVEGVSWGNEVVTLDIAGRSISVSGLSVRQRETVENLYRDFVMTGPSSLSTMLLVFRVEPAAFRKIDTRGWNYELQFEYSPSSIHMTGMDLMGRIDWQKGLSAALWVATEESGTFHGAFENFLRVLVAHALLLDRGALLHSAAVLEARGARLFAGVSGAGKSTVSRLALESGKNVPSDDLNLVSGKFTLAGSPFLGDVGSRAAGSFPLLGIYRLEKGSEDALRPMGEAEALATLLACAPFVNRSPFLGERLFTNLSALVREIPGYVLTFRLEGTFWPLLESC